ncbi:hypothetical protein EST38_g4573 [Candolleomyces aberdarensis]|uniref:DNA polymerase kappa n=1 Tax=Candolleomyces aberdarensis TaxID=2316362 RepID=A0A4Q2DQM2_9AGAR|nr:hypothetical protein EST38_g4573 [Candolleomyces aberdarensis]
MAHEEAPQPSQQTDSLLRRLAGPSATKAGLALDQSEINRIIAEVSKGSKFYENEKRKDKDLTERIERLLKQRDEALKGVDIRESLSEVNEAAVSTQPTERVEAAVDQMIEKMEAERDLTQLIVHVDMDAFYANVELLHNPGLKGKPFGVGRGVLTTASYDARKYGVRSGMATFVAQKLCPDLIIVSNHFHLYSEMSNRVMAIFRRYDDNMCPAGSDEAYLNVTEYCAEHCITVDECVSQMRQAVFDETKLTVSAGIAPNKASQIYLLICSCVSDCDIDAGQISLMDKQFGLIFLLRTYLGIASNIVEPYAREERKSIGAERTFSPLDSKEKILAKLEEVAVELEKDMEEEGWVGKTVTLKFKLDTYQVFTRAKSFGRWVSKKDELFNTGKELLLPEMPLKLRLIGLRVTKLKDLRAASDNSTGIMRFFEQVKTGAGDGSPRKRRRLDHDDLSDQGEEDEADTEAMPGFHEDDEDPGFELLEEDDIPVETAPVAGPSKPRPRPPVSAPACSPPIAAPSEHKADAANPKGKTRARAKSIGPYSNGRDLEAQISEAQPETSSSSTLECPICQKKLQTDNQGLNAHIDFCLSRGAIWDAQAETIGPSKDATKVKAKEKAEIFGRDSKGSKASGILAWGNGGGKTGKRKNRDT